MKISILVSNFHRAKLFKRSLETIKPQLQKGDEVVVADDSLFYDGMLKVLEDSGVDFQYRFLNNSKYRSGCLAKNVALKLTKNPLIIINDPEVYHVTPNIEIIRKRFEKEKRIFLVAGTMFFTTFFDQNLTNFKDMRLIEHSMAPYIGGVLRKELIAIGGWDERFKLWGNDDNDLMYRLSLNGIEHKVDDSMKAIHQWHPRPPKEIIGDANESLLYEKDKKIIANEGGGWGKE